MFQLAHIHISAGLILGFSLNGSDKEIIVDLHIETTKGLKRKIMYPVVSVYLDPMWQSLAW